MKKMLIAILLTVFTATLAMAQTHDQSLKTDELTNKSFELLIKDKDSVNLLGQTSADESIDSIFKDLGDFLADHLFSALYDDESDYKGPIKNFNAVCNKLDASTAGCHLTIHYKSTPYKSLGFKVLLNSNLEPIMIIDSRVYLSHGN